MDLHFSSSLVLVSCLLIFSTVAPTLRRPRVMGYIRVYSNMYSLNTTPCLFIH